MVAARGVWEGEDPLLFGRCCGVVVMTSSGMTVRGDFEGDGGMVTMNLYEDVFCRIFEQLLMCGASQGESKRQRNQSFPPR